MTLEAAWLAFTAWLMLLLMLPALFYLCAKYGVLGYCRGRLEFAREYETLYPKRKTDDGDQGPEGA